MIHSVGTLIDTSITKGREPGEPGTYEFLNRDCAISIADKLNSYNSSCKYIIIILGWFDIIVVEKKKMIYFSASGHPPFIKRYITTKEEAEDYIFSQDNLEATVLKPGFIYSFSERWWSLPLKYDINMWNYIHGYLMENVVPPNSLMKNILQEFYVERAVLLNDIVNTTLYCVSHSDTNGKKLFNKDIEDYSAKFVQENSNSIVWANNKWDFT